jgi:hypothetical protein
MAVDTDAEEWQRGETRASAETLTLEFLAQNGDRAFSVEEVCNGVLTLDPTVEENRMSTGGMGSSVAKAATKARFTARIEAALDALHRNGEIAARYVAGSSEVREGVHYTVSDERE